MINQYFRQSAYLELVNPMSPISSLAMDIEVAIENLLKNGTINNVSCQAVGLLSIGHSIADISSRLNFSEVKVRKMINSVCDKVAAYLGEDYFEES